MIGNDYHWEEEGILYRPGFRRRSGPTRRYVVGLFVFALAVTDREAHPLDLTIIWAQTKIQSLGNLDGINQMQRASVL